MSIKIKSFLQLIRAKNLLMLAAIQLLFKYVYFREFGVDTTLTDVQFFILVFATLAIAAAGYIRNDIYDIEADKINKPGKVLVQKTIRVATARFWYIFLNISGFLAGLYISIIVGKPSFVAIFVITILLLKVYNSDLKKRPVIGNILVSLLVSLSILIVGVFDLIPAVNPYNAKDQYYAFKVLTDYAVFAFMYMFLRELVKDVEDISGDGNMNMKTLPILLGVKRTKYLIFALSFVPLATVTFYSFNNFSNVPFILAYMLIVVLFPHLYYMTKLLYANEKKDYIKLSRILKYIMLLGMFSIVLISLTIYYAG